LLIVVTGPESSGKTKLAEQLAKYFQCDSITEQARLYLKKSSSYMPSDLLAISQVQMLAEESTSPLTFADTDQQVIYIWWQVRYGVAPTSLVARYAQQGIRHYLLCAPDLDWVADPLRENPNDRNDLFQLYRNDLDARGLSYDVVRGHGEERFMCALGAVQTFLKTLGDEI